MLALVCLFSIVYSSWAVATDSLALIHGESERVTRSVQRGQVEKVTLAYPPGTHPRTLIVNVPHGAVLVEELAVEETSALDKISVTVFGVQGNSKSATFHLSALNKNILDLSLEFSAPIQERPSVGSPALPHAVVRISVPNALLGHVRLITETAYLGLTGFRQAPSEGFRRVLHVRAPKKTRTQFSGIHAGVIIPHSGDEQRCSLNLHHEGIVRLSEIFEP